MQSVSDTPEVIPENVLYNYNHYLYGEAFLGSYKGMRYRLAREPLKNVFFEKKELQSEGASFLLTIWPEPYSYERTEDEKKKSFSFPFTEEGFKEAVLCLNNEYLSRRNEWEQGVLLFMS